VEEKKNKGEKPLSKDDWEARNKGKDEGDGKDDGGGEDEPQPMKMKRHKPSGAHPEANWPVAKGKGAGKTTEKMTKAIFSVIKQFGGKGSFPAKKFEQKAAEIEKMMGLLDKRGGDPSELPPGKERNTYKQYAEEVAGDENWKYKPSKEELKAVIQGLHQFAAGNKDDKGKTTFSS